MNQGEHNRFSECGRLGRFSADSGTQANPVNPVILSKNLYTSDFLTWAEIGMALFHEFLIVFFWTGLQD